MMVTKNEERLQVTNTIKGSYLLIDSDRNSHFVLQVSFPNSPESEVDTQRGFARRNQMSFQIDHLRNKKTDDL